MRRASRDGPVVASSSQPTRTPEKVEPAIERLRRLRKTSSGIAALLETAVSTACAVLAGSASTGCPGSSRPRLEPVLLVGTRTSEA